MRNAADSKWGRFGALWIADSVSGYHFRELSQCMRHSETIDDRASKDTPLAVARHPSAQEYIEYSSVHAVSGRDSIVCTLLEKLWEID